MSLFVITFSLLYFILGNFQFLCLFLPHDWSLFCFVRLTLWWWSYEFLKNQKTAHEQGGSLKSNIKGKMDFTLRFSVSLLLTSHLAEILLYHFFQGPCCCLNCKGCNRNVFLYFFPGWTLVCFIFNIKHSIIDPWKWFSSIFVVPTWSKDDVPIRGKKKKKKHKRRQVELKNITYVLYAFFLYLSFC